MKTNKGISTIIATIMMILFVLIATGFLWVIIQNLLTDKTDEISSGLNRISLSIVDSSVDFSESGKVSLIINRDIGEGQLSKIKIILYNLEGESYSEDVEANTLDILGNKRFTINTGGFTNIQKISVAPILKSSSNKETTQEIIANSQNSSWLTN